MNATVYTFEIDADNATRMLRAAGITGMTVTLPTNLLHLHRAAQDVIGGNSAVQNELLRQAEMLFDEQTSGGRTVSPLIVPDTMNTAAAATAAAYAAMPDAPKASRARGLYIGHAKVLLDRMSDLAEFRGDDSARWASEGFWQLMRHEPHRVPNLLTSLEKGREQDVIDALIEYVADRKQKAGNR